ncbi:MAG: LamG domain-containing protein [Leptospirales bacterium]|nr:LamG domain-containing protein [Leptospirales bacterium]
MKAEKPRPSIRMLALVVLQATAWMACSYFPADTNSDPELSLLALGNGCGASYSSAIRASSGLIAYWPLDEQSGTTGAAVVGAPNFTFVSGVTPGLDGFAPDGSSRAIGTSHVFTNITAPTYATTQLDNISMEIWMYWDGDVSAIHDVFYNGETSTQGYGIYLTPAGALTLLSGGVAASVSTYTPPVQQWTHVVLERDGGQWRLFTNAVEQSLPLNPAPNAINSITQPATRIQLANSQSTAEFFGGRLAAAAIYGVALPAAQIAAHFAAACY